MIAYHSWQIDCARQPHKNENARTYKFTSQIASSICTIMFTKRVKPDATIFTSRCSRTVMCYRLDRVQALPLSFVRFLRLANGSSKHRRRPSRRSRNGCESSDKTSGEMSRTFAGQLPGCGQCNAAECPRVNLQDYTQVGAQPARNVLVAVRATADATSSETSRKMTARNSGITISNLTPKNYELITINTQS
jgi:hypothetical protein